MADPFAPDVFPKVLVRYVPQAAIYKAIDEILPLEINGDARKNFIPKLAPDALNDVPRQMAALMAELIRLNLLRAFNKALLRRRLADVRLQGILSGEIQVDEQGEADPGAVQSLIKQRQPFVSSKTFGDFMVTARHRVCAIWVKPPNQPEGKIEGTGFLIAPDLVLTAGHVLKAALKKVVVENQDDGDDDAGGAVVRTRDEELPGSVVACVFDYWSVINPFRIGPPPPAEVQVVDVAAQWLVWSSNRHPKDGVSHLFPHPPDVSKLLDCAVIRLAKSIGAEAFESGGGRMRGWIQLPKQYDPSVATGDVIAIFQHPGGGPQSMGTGDFFDVDASQTRIWYTTAAIGGSSGSPCFDSESNIVGFHNAGKPTQYEGPSKDCNQGIRIDHVIRAMPPALLEQSQNGLSVQSALWSLSDNKDHPAPILGRTEFKSAVLQLFDPRADKRMIVVDEAKDVETVGKSGKSFSSGILEAIARDRPCLVLNFTAYKLAQYTPEGFLQEICKRIGIDEKKFETIPIKPGDERQVTRWWSNDLPDWFAHVIEDRAVQAGTASRDPVAKPAPSSPTVQDLVIKELIWIVIDDIHKAPPKGGMKELLAGMTGVTDTQPVLRAGLKALRWLVIGHVPDFVRERSIQYVPETVSQKTIGEKEWVDCVRAYFMSAGQMDRFNEGTARALYRFSLNKLDGAKDPARMLTVIGGAFVPAIKSII